MRIALHKLSDERHALEITRADGTRERVECETRSYLLHDLLHYAVESEAGLERGFWGLLAQGTALSALNDRTGGAAMARSPELPAIEQVVGALTSAAKGRPAQQVAAGLMRYYEATETTPPPWLNQAFIEAVQERMRQLVGAWKATRYGEAMQLSWPPEAPRRNLDA